jgi:phosphatidylethanolamine-binding protein (PEBP) family uncharacterized protein
MVLAKGLTTRDGLGTGGPCPLGGTTERLVFRLYALDAKLELKTPVKKERLEQAIKGHVLVQAELTCLYAREQQSRSPK